MIKKIKTAFAIISENGMTWSLLYVIEKFTIKFTDFFHNRRIKYETVNQLAGFNTINYNYKEWSNYNWNNSGEEWTPSEAWKDGIVKDVIDRYISSNKIVLELGPGGGRWSEILAVRSKHLILVDLTEKSLKVCREKLKKYPHCDFYKNNGYDLSFIEGESVDYFWSFDVFVHIAPKDVEKYIKEIERIFKSGSIGIIHHAMEGTSSKGFRSSLTNVLFSEILVRYNLKIINQISSWGINNVYKLAPNDIITIFTKY